AGPDRLRPVAAALGDEAVEERLHLLHVEREVGPPDDEVLALARPGRALSLVAVAVGDRADACGRYQALQRGRQVVHAPLQVVDDALHAARRVDDDGDVDADLAEPAHVLPERRAERPARAAAAPGAESADAGARRGEARPEIDARPERPRGTREVHDRRRRVRGRL